MSVALSGDCLSEIPSPAQCYVSPLPGPEVSTSQRGTHGSADVQPGPDRSDGEAGQWQQEGVASGGDGTQESSAAR